MVTIIGMIEPDKVAFPAEMTTIHDIFRMLKNGKLHFMLKTAIVRLRDI